MIGSGAWPKRYRPPPSLRNVLTIGWKFFTSSRLKLASPPPCLVRLSLVTGLKVLNELKKPPNSMCIRLPFTFGSNAIYASDVMAVGFALETADQYGGGSSGGGAIVLVGSLQ